MLVRRGRHTRQGTAFLTRLSSTCTSTASWTRPKVVCGPWSRRTVATGDESGASAARRTSSQTLCCGALAQLGGLKSGGSAIACVLRRAATDTWRCQTERCPFPGSVCCRMHPPLTPSNHPLCLAVISELKQCHEQHPWAKFLGACNTQKSALDACFRAEVRLRRRWAGGGVGCHSSETQNSARCPPVSLQKQVKRKANHDKAKREQERLVAKRTAAQGAS